MEERGARGRESKVTGGERRHDTLRNVCLGRDMEERRDGGMERERSGGEGEQLALLFAVLEEVDRGGGGTLEERSRKENKRRGSKTQGEQSYGTLRTLY